MTVKDLINGLKKYDKRFVYVWDDKIELWNDKFDIQEKEYRLRNQSNGEQLIKRVVLIPTMNEYTKMASKLGKDVTDLLNEFDKNEEVILAGRYFYLNGGYSLLFNEYEEVESSFSKSVRIH